MIKLIKHAAAGLLFLAGTAAAQDATPIGQTVTRAGTGRIFGVSASNFTGTATVRWLVDPVSPGRTSVSLVIFEPGARSNWHTHPAGQTLYVEDGCGSTQEEDGPISRVCKGDTVYVRAGVKHWHGATASTPVTYLTVTETLDNRDVDWLKPVSPAQYGASE
ncbi:MAG: cupin domain-containing protein [Roseiarcus sp.]